MAFWPMTDLMKAQEYSFELQADLSELKTLNQHLNKIRQATGLSEACVTEVNVCLDELFTNIVSYGFADDLEHIIQFTIHLDDHILTVNIEDDGVPFNPLKKEDPEIPDDLINVRIGGLGIHIVRKLMDDVRYQRKKGKNSLTLKKFI